MAKEPKAKKEAKQKAAKVKKPRMGLSNTGTLATYA